jgi:hypothetical protein
MKKSFSFFIALFIFSSFVSVQAMTVGTDSPKIRLTVKPGETASGVIKVNNGGNKPVKVNASISDWVYQPQGDGNKNFLPAATTPLSCAKWLNIHPMEFELYPDEIRSINYTITVPADAVGGHYAVVFFETDMGVQEIKGMNVKVKGRVGSLIYVESDGNVMRQGEVTNLNVSPPSKGEPLKIEVAFANKGNVDLIAKGTFHVIDSAGNIFVRDKLTEIYTLPGDQVKSVTTWSGNLEKGEYDLILTYDLGNNQSIIQETKLNIP